jgi:hypothetical protein
MPELSETACVLQSHFTWPPCTDHIFAAGPTRLYPHSAHLTLYTGRWVFIYVWLFHIYYFFHYKNWLKTVATLGEPMHQVAKDCLYSTLIMFLFTIGFGQTKIFHDSCWLGHTWRTIAPNDFKLRSKLVLPSHPTTFCAHLVHLILQHSLDGDNEPINNCLPKKELKFELHKPWIIRQTQLPLYVAIRVHHG